MRLVLILVFVFNSAFALIYFHNPEVIQEVKQTISTVYKEYTDQEVDSVLETLSEWQNKIINGYYHCRLNLSENNLNNNHLNLLKILLSYNQNVTNLNLSNNQFTEFDGCGFGCLQYLKLTNNNLTTFDGCGLNSLTHLFLSHNLLTSFDASNLPSLANLNLENNRLTTFVASKLLSLTYLDLKNNQLTAFDPSNLPFLRYLYLSNNLFTRFDGTGLESLQYLDLSNNGLTAFDVSNFQSLMHLHLENNSLIAFDATSLESLIVLNLSNNRLTAFDGNGLNAINYFKPFVWAVEANVAEIRLYCTRDGLNPVIKEAMIHTLRTSNNQVHQTLGFELFNQYFAADGAIAQWAEDSFYV